MKFYYVAYTWVDNTSNGVGNAYITSTGLDNKTAIELVKQNIIDLLAKERDNPNVVITNLIELRSLD